MADEAGHSAPGIGAVWQHVSKPRLSTQVSYGCRQLKHNERSTSHWNGPHAIDFSTSLWRTTGQLLWFNYERTTPRLQHWRQSQEKLAKSWPLIHGAKRACRAASPHVLTAVWHSASINLPTGPPGGVLGASSASHKWSNCDQISSHTHTAPSASCANLHCSSCPFLFRPKNKAT